MIDRLFDRLGVKIALMFVVLELTYVNSKSLLFMVHSYRLVDCFFSVVGAAAFSMVTVIVMRKSNKKRLKIAFPLFDVALMFCGLNIEYADVILSGDDNNIRFCLTIILALFTGLITYSLGFISNESHLRVNHVGIADESARNHQQTVDELQCQLAVSVGATNQYESLLSEVLPNAVRFEAWMIRKKPESNRTVYDINLCLLSDRVKAGDGVTIADYLSVKS